MLFSTPPRLLSSFVSDTSGSVSLLYISRRKSQASHSVLTSRGGRNEALGFVPALVVGDAVLYAAAFVFARAAALLRSPRRFLITRR